MQTNLSRTKRLKKTKKDFINVSFNPILHPFPAWEAPFCQKKSKKSEHYCTGYTCMWESCEFGKVLREKNSGGPRKRRIYIPPDGN
jgi:hypothetical protein